MINTLRLMIYPLVLGAERRLFKKTHEMRTLQLAQSETTCCCPQSPTGDFAVLADVVDVFPVCNRSFVPLAQVTVGAGQGQAGWSRSRRGCGVEVESDVSEHALTKKVSAIAVMAAPLRTVLKTMTWPGSYTNAGGAPTRRRWSLPNGRPRIPGSWPS
ncbi:MAG: hypothetical protein E6I00_00115 [Chloroflexi bacterium]|nr:MAG: hypothetical protein E6I00_00115 [Chloroflexota bacterium]